MDAVDLRVQAILAEGFREARADQLADPDEPCACGHVHDLHDEAWERSSRRGCSACGCEAFRAEV